LNNTEFKEVKGRLQHIRTQLYQIQNAIVNHNQVHDNRDQEKELRKQLEKWSMIEERVMRQKSRVQWLKLGMRIQDIFLLT